MKPTFLVVDDEADIRDLLTLMLEAEFEATIIAAEGVQAACQLLDQHHEHLDAIVCDFHMQDGHGDSVYLHNLQNFRIPFVLFSSGHLQEYPNLSNLPHDHHLNSSFLKPFDAKKIPKHLHKILQAKGQSPEIAKDLTEQIYKKIRVQDFLRHNKVSSDVFIRLANQKFVKVHQAQDHFDQKILENTLSHYLEKKISHIYLKDEDFSRFWTTTEQTLFSHLKSAKTPSEIQEISVLTYDYVMNNMRNIGISQTQTELVNEIIKSSLSVIGKNKNLHSLIQSFLSRENYLSHHSLLVMHIASLLLEKLEWNTPSNIKNMCFAAFFHDSFLETPEEAQVLDFDGHLTQFSLERQKIVKQHGVLAAKKLENIAEVDSFPTEAIAIVKDHHETPNGQGYPRKLTSSHLSPLSSVFIFSHELVDYLMSSDVNSVMVKNFLTINKERFNSGHFAKIFKQAELTLSIEG